MKQATTQRFVYALIFLVTVIAFMAIRIKSLEQQVAAAANLHDTMQAEFDNMSTNYAKAEIHRAETAAELARMRHGNQETEPRQMQNAPPSGHGAVKHTEGAAAINR